jgi:hypothetical protein
VPPFLGGCDERIDEAVNLKCFPAVRAGLAVLIQRIQEMLDQTLMPVMGKGHGIGATATAGGLANMLDQPRPAIDDPELSRVLDDIELRAAVELAKFERSSS